QATGESPDTTTGGNAGPTTGRNAYSTTAGAHQRPDQTTPANTIRPPPRAQFFTAQVGPVQGMVPSKPPAMRLTPNRAGAAALIRTTVRNPPRATISPMAPRSIDNPVPTSIEACSRVQNARSCHRSQSPRPLESA